MNSAVDPSLGDGARRAERRHAQRLGMLGGTYLSYCTDSLLLALFAAVDAIPLRAAIMDLVGGTALCALFFAMFATRLNERFDDPYLATPQMIASSVLLLAIACFVPQAAVLMVMLLFLVLAFAALRLRPARLFAMWILLSAALTAVLVAHRDGLSMPDATPLQTLLSGVWISLVLGRCAFIGLYGASIRQQLGRRNRELAEAQDRLETLAMRDGLTHALNRRAIMDALDAALDTSSRTRDQVVVVLADLDEFKAINDRFGHPVGDRVLQRFVALASRLLRATDYLGRYGGEEFLLVLPRAGHVTAAALIAERLRDSLAREDFGDVATGLRVTCSFGVAAAGATEPADSIVRRADEAMYRAKAAGRNRVTIAR